MAITEGEVARKVEKIKREQLNGKFDEMAAAVPSEDWSWLTDRSAGAAMYSRGLTFNSKTETWVREPEMIKADEPQRARDLEKRQLFANMTASQVNDWIEAPGWALDLLRRLDRIERRLDGQTVSTDEVKL